MTERVIGGRYRVIRLLGEGGMGAVYEAEHTSTNRRVAVKVVSDASAKRPNVIQRFLQEAKIVGAVETQHIVQVFDAGKDEETGSPYIAMELLAGEDVSQLLRRVGPLSPDLALRIAAQTCLGLGKAHAAGVIHRDIKPANLFLTRREGGDILVKILDFGIAKSTTQTDAARITATGNVLGSPSYMSPEQIKSSKSIDARTDLWSLGAVMYEMLTGLVPYHQVETVHQLIMVICTQPPPPLQDLAPWVPAEVTGAVEAAMRHDLDRRFPSAIAMHDFLSRLLPAGSSTIHESMLVPVDPRLRTTRAPRRATPAAVPAVLTVEAAPPVEPTPSARSPYVPVVITAVVAGLAIAGALAYKTRSKAAEPQVALAPTSQPSVAVVPAEITVTIQVEDGATVTVDGAPKEAPAGNLSITGKLGSTHHVVVARAGREASAEIAITETGALPSKVDLPPAAPSSTASVSPRPAAAARPAPVPAADSKAAKTGVSTKFQL
jgi:serine/threonine-protein kinase